MKQTYGGYEIPQKRIYSAEPFTRENDLVTQTPKIKREKLLEKFGAALNGLYAKE